MRKVRPRARPGLSFWPPLGNLTAEKVDRPKELALRPGKALPEERKPQDICTLEAAGGPGPKVVVGATKIRT
jgi:hypothetical protein